MVLLENFSVAARALRANLMRSILTTLGIIIGVAAVVAVVSIVQGLEYAINHQLQGVGATFIIVTPKLDRSNIPGVAARQVKLTYDDALAIEQKVPNIKKMAPTIFGRATLKYKDRKHDPAAVIGVTESYQDVNNQTVDRGRFFSQVDLDNHRKVVVIGPKVADELNLGPNPLGKEIYIDIYPATIIGIMEKKGLSLGFDVDDIAFVPFNSAVNLFGRNAADQIQIRLQAASTDDVEEVKDGVTRLLRQRHKVPDGEPDDAQVQTQDELLNSVNSVLGYVTAVVGGVVGIALLVGGIGIMNIMLVSVTERTREIGVRKAVGARRQDVLLQFLIEAVTLSLIGGGVGLAFGFGLGALVSKLIPGFPPAHVPLWAVGLAIGFSAGVGIFFGIYPAAKASRLDPIEALRYE
ncbi:MAG TPA: ABC transporter permease [Thermoanaerobaculia bacterium]|jgi:putative ABC transport system permease protein|nr:ABC transporter permease [Thermoanaerobaculia bacterium]